jgi:hypothetical protein
MYRGQIFYNLTREITAPEFNYYINSNLFQCNKAFFIVVNYGNNDYIIECSPSKYSSIKKLTHRMSKLSMILDATIKLLFVKSNENGISTETIVTSDDSIADSKD